MADPLSTAASIIAVIQVTAAVASLCYGYMSGVKRAPENLQRFMNELKLLTTVLSNLQVSAHENPEVTKLWNLEDPIKDCIAEMGSLKTKLDPKKKNWLRVAISHLQWPLEEKETMEYIWRIERLKSHFMLALAVDQQARTKVIEKHVEGITGGIEDLKNDAATQRSGVGKSELTPVKYSSLMIDYLQEQASKMNYGVAYIYFNFKEQDQQRPVDALASLVKQLACQIRYLTQEIEVLYKKLAEEQKRPTLKDLYSLLLATTKSFTKTLIVCDALDECDPESQRGELLPLFHQMERDGMSLFLTSREYPEDIQDSFQNSAKIKLWAKDEDITLYIEQKIDSNSRAKRIVGQAKCKDKIVSELIDCAKGMFLLVHFHVEYLCKQTTVRQILRELESLKEPSCDENPLSPTYDRAMEILKRQPKGCVELALKTLSWLVKARRVMTVSELQMALSVEQDQTDFDANNLPDRKTLLDVCASFITIDESTDTVRLVHYTAQEYFLKNLIIPPDADFKLAMACTIFLSFNAFAQGYCSSEVDYEARNHSYPFLDYAAKQLSFHLNKCDEALTTEIVLRFVNKSGNISSFYQAISIHNILSPDGIDRCPLHLAAGLGHCIVTGLLLRNSRVMASDCRGETALHMAAYGGHERVVELLLANGAEISAKDNRSRTAMHMSVDQGHESVVRLLLKKGVDISAKDYNGDTLLHRAVNGGSEPVVRLLLESGADISATSNYGQTALHKAAYEGSEPVVRLLLESGANISATSDYGETVLHRAVLGGSEPVVRLLLESGANISATSDYGETALHKAAYGGNKPVVRLLLESGANISATSNNGETALHKAAIAGNELAIPLLLKSGASILATRNDGWAALHLAFRYGKTLVGYLFIRALVMKTRDVLGWVIEHLE